MAIILCIETTTTNCSVAISVGGKITTIKEINNKQYSHAEKLHLFIEDVLNEANIQKTQLDAIAVSKGPGSYTGLRIGVSAAKGLCFALDIPLIAVSTLEALAYQVTSVDGVIIPMLDARRMEVYSAVFNSDKKDLREIKAEILDESSFSEYLEEGKAYFIGDGVAKFKNICSHTNAIFIEDKFPSANDMRFLAEEKFKKSEIEDVAYFEPYYLKDFVTG